MDTKSNVKDLKSIIRRDLTTAEYNKFVKKCEALKVNYKILAYVTGYPSSIVTIVTDTGDLYDCTFKFSGFNRSPTTPEIVFSGFIKRDE